MKKFLLILLIPTLLVACKKENVAKDTQAAIKGTWKSNLITDVVFDSKTNVELTRTSYLHGLATVLTFDGVGSVISRDTDLNVSVTHPYTLRNADNKRYLNTEVIGLQPTEYEILGLFDTQLELKGNIITNYSYRHSDGKNYIVYYQRTEYFTRQ